MHILSKSAHIKKALQSSFINAKSTETSKKVQHKKRGLPYCIIALISPKKRNRKKAVRLPVRSSGKFEPLHFFWICPNFYELCGDKMNHIEDNEQICLMEWAAAQSGKFPELSLIFHIPNGGKRNAREAARFKRMGVKPGVPDLFLPVPRGGCHGLFIELKAPRGKLSDHQRGWIERLKSGGYAVSVCYGSDEARRDILHYLTLEKPNRR